MCCKYYSSCPFNLHLHLTPVVGGQQAGIFAYHMGMSCSPSWRQFTTRHHMLATSQSEAARQPAWQRARPRMEAKTVSGLQLSACLACKGDEHNAELKNCEQASFYPRTGSLSNPPEQQVCSMDRVPSRVSGCLTVPCHASLPQILQHAACAYMACLSLMTETGCKKCTTPDG